MSSCDPILCVSMRLRPLASYCDRLKAQVDVFFPFDAFLCLALSLSLSIHILQTFFNCSQNTRKKTHTHTYEYWKSANCVAVRVPHSFVPSLYVCAYAEHFSVSEIKEMRISHVWITFHAITDLFFTTILLLFMIAWNVYIVCVRECVCVCICVCNNRLAQCMSANVYRCGSMRSYWIPLLQSYTRTHISIRWKCLFSMHVI